MCVINARTFQSGTGKLWLCEAVTLTIFTLCFIWQSSLSYLRSAPLCIRSCHWRVFVLLTHAKCTAVVSSWLMTESIWPWDEKNNPFKGFMKEKKITPTLNTYFLEFWWVMLVPSNAESTSMVTQAGPRLLTWLCSFTDEKSWPQVTLNTNVLCVTRAGNMLSCFTRPSKTLKFGNSLFSSFCLYYFTYFSFFLIWFLPLPLSLILLLPP